MKMAIIGIVVQPWCSENGCCDNSTISTPNVRSLHFEYLMNWTFRIWTLICWFVQALRFTALFQTVSGWMLLISLLWIGLYQGMWCELGFCCFKTKAAHLSHSSKIFIGAELLIGWLYFSFMLTETSLIFRFFFILEH